MLLLRITHTYDSLLPYYSLLLLITYLRKKKVREEQSSLVSKFELSLLVGLITPYYILLLLITHTYDSLLGQLLRLITP